MNLEPQKKDSSILISIPDLDLEDEIQYSEKEFNNLKNLYLENISNLYSNRVVEGRVLSKNKRTVLIDLNYKSDGIILFSEVKYIKDLEVGSLIPVFIEKVEDSTGRIKLSHKKARIVKAWEKIEDSYKNKTVIQSVICDIKEKGIVVDTDGIKIFVPTSQIDYRAIVPKVDSNMDLVIIKINYANSNIVGSHREVIEKDFKEQKNSILSTLRIGDIVEGNIRMIQDEQVIVDIGGGIDGYLKRYNISKTRTKEDLRKKYKINDKIVAAIYKIGRDKNDRVVIDLNIRCLEPSCWNNIPDTIQVGSKLTCEIVATVPYGFFLEVIPGVEGLLHYSNIQNSNEVYKIGDKVEVTVLTMRKDLEILSLTTKNFSIDWNCESFDKKYVVGSVHTGVISNKKKFGVFVELEPGVKGLLRTGDLCWNFEFEQILEALQENQEIDVKVLSVDKSTRRISLGLKQLTENPLIKYEKELSKGSNLSGVIVNFDNICAIVKLNNPDCKISIFNEGLANKIKDEQVKIGETINFQIIDHIDFSNKYSVSII